jgi:2-polyprenyl-3-methyl-5-hydroxy-6-metoxy-1,4-benzoquinol methylase
MLTSKCICSKESDFTPVIEYRDETVFKRFEGNIIARCTNCGMLKTFPRESNKQFDPAQSRGEYYQQDKQKFKNIFKPLVAKVLKYKNGNNILDVGCSSGILLEALRDSHLSVTGIEPNKRAFEIAHNEFGNHVVHGYLSHVYGKLNKKYDAVIYNHVMEHISDPHAEFALLKKIMKSNGILVIGVPNVDNIIFSVRKKFWEPLMPNEHVWHFTTKHMIQLLKEHHFHILDVSYEDDRRLDYPFLKRVYFGLMSLINKFLGTGEAVLIIAKRD